VGRDDRVRTPQMIEPTHQPRPPLRRLRMPAASASETPLLMGSLIQGSRAGASLWRFVLAARAGHQGTAFAITSSVALRSSTAVRTFSARSAA